MIQAGKLNPFFYCFGPAFGEKCIRAMCRTILVCSVRGLRSTKPWQPGTRPCLMNGKEGVLLVYHHTHDSAFERVWRAQGEREEKQRWTERPQIY